MQHIGVDFDVWKALTALRQAEEDDYNDVLRGLLGLPPRPGLEVTTASGTPLGKMLGGRLLPNGTKLRARHKGQLYTAAIVEGRLVDAVGTAFNSASAAASAVTKTNVNGLSFWEVKRPTDPEWRKLISLARVK